MKDRVTSLLRIRPPIIDNRGFLWGSGATVPDGEDGWQTGAIFQQTDGAHGTCLYVNEGSVTVSNFVAVDTVEGDSSGAIVFDAATTGPCISTPDGYDDSFIETGTYASTGSEGIVLSETNNRPVSFLFDDGNTEFTGGDIRAGLFRILLTTDHDIAVTINALRAQIKANNEVDITSPSSVTSPFTGYLELDGAGDRHLDGHVACVRAALETGAGAHTVDINLCGFEATLNSSGTFVGSGYSAAFAANISGGTSLWQYGLYLEDAAVLTTGVRIGTTATGISIGACSGTAIDITGKVTTRILDYDTVTAIDEPGIGHLTRYGTLAAPIQWTPTATCSGFDMNVTTTGPEAGGFGLATVRVKTVVTGTTKITVNAGQFWTKIDCTDYTGHYLGGHPTGLSGIIECAGTARTAGSVYAVMAGVCGEVRPVSSSGTVNMGGVICGLHAKVFAVSTEVDTGDVVGLLVQAIGGSAADIGILIQPHTGGAAWTTGIKLDPSYGPIPTGITIGACTDGIVLTGVTEYAIDIATSGVFRMGEQDSAIALTTAYPFGVEVQTIASTDVASVDTGSSAGIYSRYEIGIDQTELCNHIAVFAKLRVKESLEDGVHCGVYALVEASGAGTIISGDVDTQTCAGHFALDFDSNLDIDTGHLNGICIDCSVDDSADIAATTMSAIRIKKSAGAYAWPTGIEIEASAATTAINIAGCTKALEAVVACATTKYGASIVSTLTDGESDGIAAYFEGHVAGTPTGQCFAVGAWLNVDAAPSGAVTLRALDVGVYTAQDLSDVSVYGMNISLHLGSGGAPVDAYQMRFNHTGHALDAWFHASNAGAIGFAAGTDEGATKVGDIPIAITGYGTVYIKVYDGTS